MTWLICQSGRSVELRCLAADDIALPDIAHALSLINRFNGHTVRPYSVAEHSLLVADIAERELGITSPHVLLAALLHDAHEAYTGDMVTPMKQLLGAAWELEEARIERQVLKTFGLLTAYATAAEAIKRADLIALATERRDLIAADDGARQWPCLAGITPLRDKHLRTYAMGLDWQDWRQAFIDRWHELDFARSECRLAAG